MTESFAELDLNTRLLRALGNNQYQRPTEVQAEVIPALLEGRDLLVQSPTGSGKTLAYLLPVMHLLLEQHGRKGGPHALVLVPTRELARQVFKEAIRFAEHTSLRVVSIAGGESYAEQLQRLHQHLPDLLIATPGRLLRALEDATLALFDVQLCVLDEADRMLDMGFAAEIGDILQLLPEQRQLLLFSATLEEGDLSGFANDWLHDPLLLSIGSARSLPSHIQQRAYLADSLEHKLALLGDILAQGGHSLVFTYSRDRCEQIASQLQARGIACSALHGEMPQRQRNRVLHQFSEQRLGVLVTTDLAARGLHIEDVGRVIHFDLPRSAELYVHRSGRTGRGGEGEALLLVEAHDARLLGRIERYQQQQIPRAVRQGLEPRHKEPEFKRKKKKKKPVAPKLEKKKPKLRWRDSKNKGKPKRSSIP
ncbi:MAG: DEAD/DEAH box helicase [Gammaproteobacteria bacterium SHHR-1]|uniref:DEAD/DEAH box helicase n=1 Tax=Magnetovirga frankeli TaxID=947516 RepID=UPI001293FFC3|nr:DEAD/DEAH box helicase [gamma proteobacterium SS-5]